MYVYINLYSLLSKCYVCQKYVCTYVATKYGTAQRQLDTRTRVASWPTADGPAESVQTGASVHPHPQP